MYLLTIRKHFKISVSLTVGHLLIFDISFTDNFGSSSNEYFVNGVPDIATTPFIELRDNFDVDKYIALVAPEPCPITFICFGSPPKNEIYSLTQRIAVIISNNAKFPENSVLPSPIIPNVPKRYCIETIITPFRVNGSGYI